MRRATLAAPAVGALALVLILSACTGNDSGVRLATVGRGTVVETVDASATVTARAVATLTAPADGTLTALPAPPGTVVRAGQVVAVIDSPSARERLADAQDALAASAGAGLAAGGGDLGTTDLERASARTDREAAASFAAARRTAGQVADARLRATLLAQVDAAARGYEQTAASARAAVAAVRRGVAGVSSALASLGEAQRVQARSAYRLAKATVDALVLRAPIGGVVQSPAGTTGGGGSLSDLLGSAASAGLGGAGAATPAAGTPSGPGVDPAVPLGGHVGAGSPVLTIVDTGRLGLLAEVDETDVLLVASGVVGSLELDAAPGARYDVVVRAVDALPTGSTGGGVSYRARLALRAGRYPDGRAAPTPRPGMSGVAHLEVRSAQDAVVVPAAAVFTDGDRDAVWVVRSGRAVKQVVRSGIPGADQVQILDGVAPGDRVVVSGADKVRAGQRLP